MSSVDGWFDRHRLSVSIRISPSQIPRARVITSADDLARLPASLHALSIHACADTVNELDYRLELPSQVAARLPKAVERLTIGQIGKVSKQLRCPSFEQLPVTTILNLNMVLIESWRGFDRDRSLRRLTLSLSTVLRSAGLLSLLQVPELEIDYHKPAMKFGYPEYRTAIKLLEHARKSRLSPVELVEKLHELGCEEWARY